MSGKPLKCPECPFRGCSLKGMKIHRRKKHHNYNSRLPRNARRPLNPLSKLPREFVASLSPDQLELIEAQYNSHKVVPPPCRQSADSGSDGGQRTTPDGSANPATSDYGSSGSSPSDPSMSQTQQGDGTPNPDNPGLLNVNDPAGFSYSAETDMSESALVRPGAARIPASPASNGDAEIVPGSTGRVGLPPYLTRLESTSFSQSSEPPSLLYSAPAGRQERASLPQGPEQSSDPPRDSLAAGRNTPDDTFIEYDMLGFQSIERNTDQGQPKVFHPGDPRMSRNERSFPAEYHDQNGDMQNSYRFCSPHGLPRTRSVGRNALKNLWPACFFDMTFVQPHGDGVLPRREDESRACRDLLTILGDCAVLDYNASSAWDLVLRCSLCEMPMSGVRNMEAHIKRHLQQTPNQYEARC